MDSWAEHQRQHGRFTVADRELEKRVISYALGPSTVKHYIYAKRKDYARALDYWNRSLSIQPQQPPIRQAADAARTRL